MITVIDFVSYAVAIALAIPCWVFCAECVLGALAARARPAAGSNDRTRGGRVAVLMPAHDEQAVIGEALAGLRPELRESDRLLVVADNCSDDTAAIARAAGATVIERRDAARRGKGYALAFGLDHLAADPPDVVVIMDADCAISRGGIDRLAELAVTLDRPAQADYTLRPPHDPQDLAVVSALAFIVKNRARPRGLHALGFPVMLTGSGMAFPWHVIRRAPPTEGNLVEDMMMGLDLAELGFPPALCPDARVTSVLPDHLPAAAAQRRRWEHGHIATLLAHGPRLIAAGIRRRRLSLLALGLDLMVPPLALLVMLVGVALAATVVAAALGAAAGPAWLLGVNLCLLTLGVLSAWYAYGRDKLRPRQLLSIPLYAAWKVPLYLSFLVRGRHGTWERTERQVKGPGDPPS